MRTKSAFGEQADFEKSLRLLKNAFLKTHIQSQTDTPEIFTALLLIMALQYLEGHNKLDNLTIFPSHSKTHLNDFPPKKLFALGTYLFKALQSFLPDNIKKAMPAASEKDFVYAQSFLYENRIKNTTNDISFLGFAYQIFNLPSRKKSLQAVQAANKAISKQQLIDFTQLYTPTWAVKFLLANTVLPLTHIDKSIPQSILEALLSFKQWHYNCDQNNNRDLSTIRILDPASGTGQFLLPAFDLCLALYQMNGLSAHEAISIILSHNLFGADIDEKALWTLGLGLIAKCLTVEKLQQYKPFNLCLAEDQIGTKVELGSIDRRWENTNYFLAEKFDIVATNPPYIGRKLLSRDMKANLKIQYPMCRTDLCTAFLQSCLERLLPGGRIGLITQRSFLSLPSYRDLRHYLITNYSLKSTVLCGPRVFPLMTGEKIDSMLIVAERPQGNTVVNNTAPAPLFLDLTKEKNKSGILRAILSTINNGKGETKSIQSNIYDINFAEKLFDVLNSSNEVLSLGDIAEVKQGLATTDNARFVRYVWDVDPDLLNKKWFPYLKGAGSERWYCKNEFVVNWQDNGAEIKQAVAEAYPYLRGKTAWVVKNEQYYFTEGLSFSFINKAGLAVRRLPPGSIFDVASSGIFPKQDEENFLFAYLNSSLISILAKLINPTINLQVGDLKRLPIFPFTKEIKNKLSNLAEHCFDTKRKIVHSMDSFFETEININHSDQKISDHELEKLFSKIAYQLSSQHDALTEGQAEIDRIVATGIKDTHLLDESTLSKLFYVVQESNCKNGKNTYSRKEFAQQFMVNSIHQLLSQNQSKELPSVIPISQPNSLYSYFGITDSGSIWLEKYLGKSFKQLFLENRSINLSKQFGQPSRYFCLHLAEVAGLLFISSLALRQSSKISHNHDFAENYFKQSPISQDTRDFARLKQNARLISDKITDHLHSTENWQGVDLADVLKSQWN